MAFAVYDHTPLVGYIQWQDLNIAYQGTSYAITNGYTSDPYVWWDPAVSTTTLQTGTSLPALSDDALLVFLNKSGVHVTVPKATVVDGSLIVEESILTNALAANSVTTDKIVAGAIISEKIGAGEVLALNLAAGSVEADKIAVNAVTAGKIAAGAVETDKLAANAVNADKIAANAVDADAIAANAVTADKIQANAVTAAKLASITMEVGKHIQSSDYDGTDVATGDATTGFRMEAGGAAEFSDVRVRGEVTATEFHGADVANICTNPGFETDTSGWSAKTSDFADATIVRTTTAGQYRSGSAGLRVYRSGGSAGTPSAVYEQAVSPGSVIYASGYIKAADVVISGGDELQSLYVVIEVYDSADNLIWSDSHQEPRRSTSQFNKVTHYAPIPNGGLWDDASYALISFSTYATSSAGFYLDDVTIGLAPLMEIPYLVTNADGVERRAEVLPHFIGFHYADEYPYGLLARGSGLEVRGPYFPGATGGNEIGKLKLTGQDGFGVTTTAELEASEVVIDSPTVRLDGVSLATSDGDSFDLVSKVAGPLIIHSFTDDLDSSTWEVWGDTASVYIPTWATRALVMVSVIGSYGVTAGGTGINLKMNLGDSSTAAGAGNGTTMALSSDGAGLRNTWTWSEEVSLSVTGNREVRIDGRRSSGSGARRLDTQSRFSFFIIWLP